MARKDRKSNRSSESTEVRRLRELEPGDSDERLEDEDEIEIVRVDPENEGEHYNTDGETRLSFKTIDAENNEEKVMDEIDDFTEDKEILQDFSERQRMINEGSDELDEKLEQQHFLSPDLSGDDIDAAWEDSTVSGEESVGGSAPTPDQDVVDELGEALGIGYQDDEPLHTADKLEDRDLDRWELNPASVEEIEEQEEKSAEQDEDESTLYLEGGYEVEMLEDEDEENEEEEDEELKDEDEGFVEDKLLEDDIEEDEYDDLDLEEDELDDYLDELEEED